MAAISECAPEHDSGRAKTGTEPACALLCAQKSLAGAKEKDHHDESHYYPYALAACDRHAVPQRERRRRRCPHEEQEEGRQGRRSAAAEAGGRAVERCGTCHDPHEVTQNDWRDPYTKPGLKKNCQDCHTQQAEFFKENNIHGTNDCTSCHMPVMMSCENFNTIQYPDYGGFDNTRASHIWKILVDPSAKTLNPPEGKDRNFKDGPWRLAKKDGKPYIDLMWSCGRTSFSDGNILQGGGCHSPAQSSQPKELQFTNQKMIYDKVMTWQTPVKQGVSDVNTKIAAINSKLTASRLPQSQKAQIQVMVNQANDIIKAVTKDGSWGVHAPDFTLQKVKEAQLLVDGAQAALKGQRLQAATTVNK